MNCICRASWDKQALDLILVLSSLTSFPFPSLPSLPPSILPSQEKCAQYWPTQEEHDTTFRDTRFKVTLVSEDVKSYYTTRVLELQNITVRSFLFGFMKHVEVPHPQVITRSKNVEEEALFIVELSALWFPSVLTKTLRSISYSTPSHLHPQLELWLMRLEIISTNS